MNVQTNNFNDLTKQQKGMYKLTAVEQKYSIEKKKSVIYKDIPKRNIRNE